MEQRSLDVDQHERLQDADGKGADDDDEDDEDEDGVGDEDDEDEDAGDEDEDEYDDDEDDEPKLKYQRLAGTLSETLKKDAVSTMAVSDRFLVGKIKVAPLNTLEANSFHRHSERIGALFTSST